VKQSGSEAGSGSCDQLVLTRPAVGIMVDFIDAVATPKLGRKFLGKGIKFVVQEL
jgi:hypothetical protein